MEFNLGYRKRIDAKAAESLVRINNLEFNRAKTAIRKMIDLHIINAITSGKLEAKFSIPDSVAGYGTYDVGRMGVSIVRDLVTDGYRIKGTFKNFVIKWKDPDNTFL